MLQIQLFLISAILKVVNNILFTVSIPEYCRKHKTEDSWTMTIALFYTFCSRKGIREDTIVKDMSSHIIFVLFVLFICLKRTL